MYRLGTGLQYLLYANFTSSIATQCHIIISTCDHSKHWQKSLLYTKQSLPKETNLSLYAVQTGLKHNPTISNCYMKKLLPLCYVPGLRISTDNSFALAPFARSRTPSFSLILACKDSIDWETSPGPSFTVTSRRDDPLFMHLELYEMDISIHNPLFPITRGFYSMLLSIADQRGVVVIAPNLIGHEKTVSAFLMY